MVFNERNSTPILRIATWKICGEGSKTHFRMRLHKRVIDLYSSSEIVKQITTINIKPGVEAVVSIAKIIVIRMVKMGMIVGTARFITAAATGFGMVMPIIPIIPSVNTCMKLTSTNTTTTTTTANPMPVLVVNTTQLQLFADVCSTVTSVPESVPAPIMNSLVSATKVVTNESLPNPVAAAVMNLAIPTTIPISSIPGPIMSINTTDMIEDCAEDKGNMSEPLEDDAVIENDLEQQQLDESAGKRKSMEIPLFVDEELKTEEEVQAKLDLDENEVKIVDASEENVTVNEEVTCSGSRQVESSDTSLISNAELAEFKNAHEKELTCADIMLLCDYLPLEHGRKALQLLAEFHWLRINAQVLCKNRSRKPSLATTPTAGDSDRGRRWGIPYAILEGVGGFELTG
ncbi:conserved hypothetical protein [Culex quinquefasciatus]|uniref:Small ribosomal subunit protein uS10 domain-containing protein n=1 Tax=Culex quinquefasciatus TaxID=7176 RepID=B0XAR5_CULQU|nr:conserved hypothetical protein [Culex quinquefasciatus]|eukprot:XP_001866737.1 conserved hypothetical protein [Culex quinquefasciatus]